jgi:hypothetical protein
MCPLHLHATPDVPWVFLAFRWSFSEFSEALCRLAATAYPTSDAVPVPAAKERSSGVSTWLSAALKQLLNDHILPRVPASAGVAVAVSVGEEDFRRRVGSSAVRAVHKKFEGTLRKLFRHYAKAGQRGEMVVMSLFQLVEFCQVKSDSCPLAALPYTTSGTTSYDCSSSTGRSCGGSTRV